MPYGKLDVYVEGGVGIKDTALLGKGSPYCTLTMGNQVFSTPVVEEGGSHPYFNTSFKFKVDRSTPQLQVTIFSKNSLTEDDLLGYCTIMFKDAFYHSHVLPVLPYDLTRPSGRPGGQIRLSLTFYAEPRPEGYREAPVRRPQLPPGPQVRPPGPHFRPPGPRPAHGGQYPQPPPHRRQSTGQPQYYVDAGSSYARRPPPLNNSQRPVQRDIDSRSRRSEESASISSDNSGSDSDDDDQAPGPYQPRPAHPAAAYNNNINNQAAAFSQGRGRPRPPGPVAGPRPPGPSYNAQIRPGPRVAVNLQQQQQPAAASVAGAAMGSFFKNVGSSLLGAAVGSFLGSDGDLSWGAGDDVSFDGSFDSFDAESYGSVDAAYYDEAAESYERYPEKSSQSTAYAFAYADNNAQANQAPGYARGARGRGRGPGRGPGRAPMRGGRGAMPRGR